MYHPADNQIGLTIDGTKVVQIISAGLMINDTQFTGGSGGSSSRISAAAPLSLSANNVLTLITNSVLTSSGGNLGVNYDNSTIIADSTTPFALKVANPTHSQIMEVH